MILELLSIVILALNARGTEAAECLEPASRVISRWKNGNYYKGEIESITNRVNVLFDNGARLAYNPRDNVDIVVDRIPDHTEIPWGSRVIVNRPRSRAFEMGDIREIRNGRLAVLYENGDTIYHTLDQIRAFNKSLICDEPAYLGCFRDNLPRNLEVYIPTRPATIGSCVDACKSQGFSIGALRNSDLCFCGNSYNKSYQVPDKECDMPCYDNSFEICGGFMTFSQYWTGIVDSEGENKPGIQKHFIPSNSPIPWELLMHTRSKHPPHATSGATRHSAWYLSQSSRGSRPQGVTDLAQFLQQQQNRLTGFSPQYPGKLRYQGNPYQGTYGTQPGVENYSRYQANRQLSRYNYPMQASSYGLQRKQTSQWPYPYNYNSYRNYKYQTAAANNPNNGYNNVYQRRPAVRPSPEEHAKLMSLLKKVNWGLYQGILQASAPAPIAFRYLGCFQDSEARDLQTAVDVRPLTIEACILKCRRSGFSVAGVQLSTQCYCGNTYSRYGRLRNDRCTMRCTGNYHEICGGQMKNSVFYTGVGQAIPYTEKYGPRKQAITFKQNTPHQNHPKTTMKQQLMDRKPQPFTKTAPLSKMTPQVAKNRYKTSKQKPMKIGLPSLNKAGKLNRYPPIEDFSQLKKILLMLSKWNQQPLKIVKNTTIKQKAMPSHSQLRKILEDMTPDIVKKIANKIIAEQANKSKLSAMKPLSAVKSLEVNLASTKPTASLDPGFKRLKVKSPTFKNWSKKGNHKDVKQKTEDRSKSPKSNSNSGVLLEADARHFHPSTSGISTTKNGDTVAKGQKHPGKFNGSSASFKKANSTTSGRQGSLRYAAQRITEVRDVNENTTQGLPSFIPIADKEKKHRVRTNSQLKSSHSFHKQNQTARKRIQAAKNNFLASDLQSNKRHFVKFVVTENAAKKNQIPNVNNSATLSKDVVQGNGTRTLGSPEHRTKNSHRSENRIRNDAQQTTNHKDSHKHSQDKMKKNTAHGHKMKTTSDRVSKQNITPTGDNMLLIKMPVTHSTNQKHQTTPHKVLHVEANWNGQIRLKANWKDEEPEIKAKDIPKKKSKVKPAEKLQTRKSSSFSEDEDGSEGQNFDDSGSRNELVWSRSRTRNELLHNE